MIKINNLSLFVLLICLSCSSLKTVNKNYNFKLQEKKALLHILHVHLGHTMSLVVTVLVLEAVVIYILMKTLKCPAVCTSGFFV